MNLAHRWLWRSANWRNVVENHILPWTLEDVDLGSDLLEVGPGPGISTDLLHRRVARLTCVEIDRSYAEKLRRGSPSNVDVLCGDATKMSLADESFDAAVCFTMLHHVPSALQDPLMREVARVLRPDAIFAGTNSLYSRSFRLLHVFDTMVAFDPATLPSRLRSARFEDVRVSSNQSSGAPRRP
jgi:ubiquinone/menaquinone biosynthesis C-methylase UbiE